MTIRTFEIEFDGSAQSLDTLLAATVQDVAVYAVDIQAHASNSNTFTVGGSTVSANLGIVIPTPVSNIPEAPYRVGDFGGKSLYLKDIFVFGTSTQKARILVFA